MPAAGGAWGGSSTGAWGGGGSSAADYAAPAPADMAAPVPAAASLGKADDRKSVRQADLNKREAELNKREAELRRLELELRNNPGGKSTKNWPRFCPVLHHDIAGEVPAASQVPVRRAYWAYLVRRLLAALGAAGAAAAGRSCSGRAQPLWAGRSALQAAALPPRAHSLRRTHNGCRA